MSATVSAYYHAWESRIGYKLILGGTRHFGYYEKGTWWPFPIGTALRRMERHLYDTLGVRQDALILDAGTGNGDVAIFMAKKGLRVRAIDLLDMNVGWAKANVKQEKLESRMEVSQGSYEELEFDDNTFDGVYSMETLVHAENPDQALEEIYRVLKPGGIAVNVVYEHDMDSNPAGRRALTWINTHSHMPAFDQFTLGTIRRKMEDTGFRDVEVQDLTDNVAPLMRFFFLLAYVPYLIVQLLGLKARFVNTVAGVEFWRHGDNLRYLMIRASKPLQ